MTDTEQNIPSEEEVAEMIAGDSKRKSKPDPDMPTSRLPEAAYFYLFILIEAALLVGVWGFMGLGIQGVAQSPSFEAPILEQLQYHLWSIWHGLGIVAADKPWVLAMCAAIAGVVFFPKTSRRRKSAAKLVLTIIAVVFVLLITIQFKADMANAANMMH